MSIYKMQKSENSIFRIKKFSRNDKSLIKGKTLSYFVVRREKKDRLGLDIDESKDFRFFKI